MYSRCKPESVQRSRAHQENERTRHEGLFRSAACKTAKSCCDRRRRASVTGDRRSNGAAVLEGRTRRRRIRFGVRAYGGGAPDGGDASRRTKLGPGHLRLPSTV